jgi:hypothetical protein
LGEYREEILLVLEWWFTSPGDSNDKKTRAGADHLELS